VIDDPEVRRQLAKQGRLWGFSLICAAAGALTVQRTGSLGAAVVVFLVTVVVLGPLLWAYERRRRNRG